MSTGTLRDWYVTFSDEHFLKDRTPMSDYCVKLTAEHKAEAKHLFIKHFGIPHLKSPFMYNDLQLEANLPVLGSFEYRDLIAHITKDTKGNCVFYLKCWDCNSPLIYPSRTMSMCESCKKEHYL